MKKSILTLLLIAASIFASAQSITHTYHFGQPMVQQVGEYQMLSFDSTVSNGTVGEPMLPWQSVSLMLPQNTEATAIHVTLSDFVELEGQYNIMPTQKARPVSDESPFVFEKDEALYHSNEAYPTKTFNGVSTQVRFVCLRRLHAREIQARLGSGELCPNRDGHCGISNCPHRQ